MFAVKEYSSDKSYIGHSEYRNIEPALAAASTVFEVHHIGCRVMVTELDYDKDGVLKETIIFEKVKYE